MTSTTPPNPPDELDLDTILEQFRDVITEQPTVNTEIGWEVVGEKIQEAENRARAALQSYVEHEVLKGRLNEAKNSRKMTTGISAADYDQQLVRRIAELQAALSKEKHNE